MSGFDNAAVDAAFFADTPRVKSNFIATLGYGDPATIFERLPRPDDPRRVSAVYIDQPASRQIELIRQAAVRWPECDVMVVSIFGDEAHVMGAIAAGAIASDDPLLVALTLWSGTHGVATVLQLGFGLPPELEDAMIDEVTDRLLAGYRP
mgnify:CR=1 FL=1